jgi:alpha-1,2-mannosyltransferase
LIGLAAAVKLTPAIFVIYLLAIGRIRAASVAVASAIAVTVAAAVASPGASREYFFDLFWHLATRVGLQNPETIGNQSLKGALLRLVPGQVVTPLWIVALLVCVAVGPWLMHRAWRRRGDIAGACVTGLFGVVVSPISWVHHFVWLIPASALLGGSARRRDRVVAAAAALLMCLRGPRLGLMLSQHTSLWLWDGFALLLQDTYLLLAATIALWLALVAPPAATERRRVAAA